MCTLTDRHQAIVPLQKNACAGHSDPHEYFLIRNTAHHCRLRMFQDRDFAGDLEDSKSTSAGILCIFGVEHSFPEVGCARSKRQFLTVRRNLTLFLLMQVYAWIEFPLSISGVWLLKYCTLHQNEVNKFKGQESQGNLSRNTKLHMKNQNPAKHVNLDLKKCWSRFI